MPLGVGLYLFAVGGAAVAFVAGVSHVSREDAAEKEPLIAAATLIDTDEANENEILDCYAYKRALFRCASTARYY